jgi:hypothetical protein
MRTFHRGWALLDSKERGPVAMGKAHSYGIRRARGARERVLRGGSVVAERREPRRTLDASPSEGPEQECV